MNKKETELYRIVDVVVGCCRTEVDLGVYSVSREDVLGRCKRENVVMTRCILCRQLVWAGYSTDTIGMLLGKSVQAVRSMIQKGDDYHRCSRAYRIAEAEATTILKDIEVN